MFISNLIYSDTVYLDINKEIYMHYLPSCYGIDHFMIRTG